MIQITQSEWGLVCDKRREDRVKRLQIGFCNEEFHPGFTTKPMVGFQCPFTKACANNQCFWKQRDCHGLQPFVNIHETQIEKLRDQERLEKYGKPYFPEWSTSVGTNSMYMSCKDFKWEENSCNNTDNSSEKSWPTEIVNQQGQN